MRSSERFKLYSIMSRVGIWVLIASLLYVLRSFFLLIFLTFVFAFLQSHAVNFLGRWIGPRTPRVWLVGSFMLILLLGIGLFIGPKLTQQTRVFVSNASAYTQVLDEHIYHLGERFPYVADFLPQLRESGESPTLSIGKQLLGIHGTDTLEEALQGASEDGSQVNELLGKLMKLSGMIAGILSAFLLSLLFSFLIVLDLPRLTQSVRSLEHSRLGFAYREVAPSVVGFATVLGQALEAQFRIAVLNSVLTAIGLWILGLGHYLAFLSAIVFLFSFVPVAGVFISSIPICLIALQIHGVQTMFLAVVMITVIHIVEAYILNPQIYGSRMSINPVIVLVILTIGGKLFHFWGLVLGVPVCTWLIGHVLQVSSKDSPET